MVMEKAQVEVVRDYGELPTLTGVPANLEQVFVNLVTNACHAMRPGGRLTLCTRCEGREAVVEVRDTGSGASVGKIVPVYCRDILAYMPRVAGSRKRRTRRPMAAARTIWNPTHLPIVLVASSVEKRPKPTSATDPAAMPALTAMIASTTL